MPLTLANAEIIWLLIVAASVIGQIIKGAKKVSSQAPGKRPPPPPGNETQQSKTSPLPFEDPEEALRDFFKNLGAPTAPNKQPASSPPPPPNVKNKKSIRNHQLPATRRTAQPQANQAPQKKPTYKNPYQQYEKHHKGESSTISVKTPELEILPGSRTSQLTMPTTQAANIPIGMAPVSRSQTKINIRNSDSPLVADIKKTLMDTQKSRNAIILGEIIGPPLALRGAGSAR